SDAAGAERRCWRRATLLAQSDAAGTERRCWRRATLLVQSDAAGAAVLLAQSVKLGACGWIERRQRDARSDRAQSLAIPYLPTITEPLRQRLRSRALAPPYQQSV